MRSLTLVAAALVVATSSPLAAQEAPVDPGARVRVTAPDLGIDKYTGVLEGVVGDTLAVDTLRLALASVTRLEVHRGRKSNVGKGALIGLAGGAAAGVGFSVWFTNAGEFDFDKVALVFVPIFSAAGTGIGALLGAASKVDRWEEVPLDRIRVSVTPLGNGGLTILVSVKVP